MQASKCSLPSISKNDNFIYTPLRVFCPPPLAVLCWCLLVFPNQNNFARFGVHNGNICAVLIPFHRYLLVFVAVFFGVACRWCFLLCCFVVVVDFSHFVYTPFYLFFLFWYSVFIFNQKSTNKNIICYMPA